MACNFKENIWPKMLSVRNTQKHVLMD